MFKSNRTFKIAVFILLLSLLYLSVGCQEIETNALTEQKARAIIDGYLKFRNEGDTTALDQILHQNCIIDYSNLPQVIEGIDAFKEYDKTTRIAFPDFTMTIDEFFIAGDKIISYWTLDATNTGPMGNLPPTNKKVHVSGVAISKVVDGKIIEDFAYFNVLEMMQQLGFQLIPPQ